MLLSYTLHGVTVKYRAISEANRADLGENYLHITYTDTNRPRSRFYERKKQYLV